MTRQVHTLEEDLGVTLFERNGPRIVPTPAGILLHRLAGPLVESLDRLPDTFTERYHGVASGAVDIAAGQTSASMLLPEYLKEFQRRHPEVRVNVRIGSGRERLRWLRAYQVDLALIAVDVPPPDLAFHPVRSSDFVFITPEDHPLAGRESVAIAEVAAYPAVTHIPSHYVGQNMDILMRMHGAVPNTVLEVDGWNVIKLHVAAGVGIAAVPDLCVSEDDRVWSIPASRYFPARVYGVLARRDKLLSLAAQWLIRLLEEHHPGDP